MAAEVPKRGRWIREVWDSTIGKKVIVAITGLALALYVFLHAFGNLKALQGPGDGSATVDRYAEWLRTLGEPALPRNGFLWILRAILIGALVLHVVAISQLYRRNRAARPPQHREAKRIQRSLASRTMTLTGVLLLAFIIFHILQFTTETIQVTPIRRGTVYANLYDAFQKWYFALIYVAAVVLLGLHLRHALWSVTQTAGWDQPNRNPTFRRTATTLAVVVTVAFAAVPVAFFAGAMPEPSATETALVSGSQR